MNDLVEFLLACLAADEATAKDAAWDGYTWIPEPCHVARADVDVCVTVNPTDAEHIAHWDPPRVLAECEAKRRIIVRCSEMQVSAVPMAVHLASRTLVDLALPYADRPGYREEWRP